MSRSPWHYWRALLAREFWEHRAGLVWTPLGVLATFALLLLFGLFAAELKVMVGDVDLTTRGVLRGLERAAQPSALTGVWKQVWFGLVHLFYVVMALVLFFYALGALYDDRRDRSVLFWRSLPVAERDHVLAKVVIVLALAPLLYLVAALAAYLTGLMFVTVFFWLRESSGWALVWRPGLSHGGFLGAAALIGVNQLWLAPIYAWLLFCSAWARTRPVLWATLVPLAAIFAEAWIRFVLGSRGDGVLWRWLGERLLGLFSPSSVLIGSGFSAAKTSDLPQALAPLTGLELWAGLALAVALTVASILLRRYRDDSTT